MHFCNWPLSLLLIASTQAQTEDGYCIDFGRDAPDRPHWLSPWTGSYQYQGEINGKPSYKQISCTDPTFVDNCNIPDERQLFYNGNDWRFGTGDNYQFCQDNPQPEQPNLCQKYWGLSAVLQEKGYPIFTLGSCTNPSDPSDPSDPVRQFIVNNDPNQHIKINENTEWIANANDLLQCNLKGDETKYIVMTQDNYNNNNIKDKRILLMSEQVFNDINLSPECKFPVLKILDSPQPQILSNNQIKIYVTTGVSMTDYIEDIDVDLTEITMTFLDPNYISIPNEETFIPSSTTGDDSMEYDETSLEIDATEYTVECTENCQDFDSDKYFGDYVASDYRDTLKESNYNYISKSAQQYPSSDNRRRLESLENEWTMNVNPRRRRLGWGNPFKAAFKWVKKTIIAPVVKFVKTVIQIIKGDVNYTKEFGITADHKKSKTFKSKYKRKKSGSKAIIDGKIELEYGVKFELKLEAKLKAKWTYIPAKLHHLYFSIGGSTEFLTWFKAELTASANVDMQLFKREKYYTFMIGPIPVVTTLEGRVDFNLNTEIQVKFMQQFGYEKMFIEVGTQYDESNGWREVKNSNLEFKPIITSDFAFNGNYNDGEDIICPFVQEIKATLTPRIGVSLYKLVHLSVEKDFELINDFEIGDSCNDNINTCQILNNDQINNVNALGISTSLDFNSPDLKLILGVGIDILGIKLFNWDKAFELGASFGIDGIVEECFDLIPALDGPLKNICKCKVEDEDTHLCLNGLENDNAALGVLGSNGASKLNGEYKAVAVGSYNGIRLYNWSQNKAISRPFNEEFDDCTKVWCIYKAINEVSGSTPPYIGVGYDQDCSDCNAFNVWGMWKELPQDAFKWDRAISWNGQIVHNPADLDNVKKSGIIKKGRC